MRKNLLLVTVLCFLLGACTAKDEEPTSVVVAYVTSWSSSIPDPEFVTHVNYAFGHVTQTFDGVRVDNEDRLHEISKLKDQYPDLKVLLSIGGWGSGNFSEMAASETNRTSFANDCQRVVKEFNLDGIDIDWEYPGSNMAGISALPEDKENFTLLMAAIRKSIGSKKLLTLASSADPSYIDFVEVMKSVDFVNVMTYDMNASPLHHSGLYASEMTGGLCDDISVKNHIEAGVPADRLVLGIPFYGHGCKTVRSYIDYKDILKLEDITYNWDTVAYVPYLKNIDGDVVCNFEDSRSIAIKCGYIKDNGLRGAMYWDYDADDEEGTLRTAVFQGIFE